MYIPVEIDSTRTCVSYLCTVHSEYVVKVCRSGEGLTKRYEPVPKKNRSHNHKKLQSQQQQQTTTTTIHLSTNSVSAVTIASSATICQTYHKMTTKSLLLPTQKICFVLSLVIVISMRWNDETGFQILPPNSFGSVFVSSFRSTSVTLSKQQHQQQKIPNQIPSKEFNRWGYNHHHHQHGTSSTRSMSRYAHRDPLIMMPSQTPMVPYKVCKHIYIYQSICTIAFLVSCSNSSTGTWIFFLESSYFTTGIPFPFPFLKCCM